MKNESRGILFPKTSGGKRSTIEFGKRIWSAAAKAAGISQKLQDSLVNEKDFRHKYIDYIQAIYDKAAEDANVMYAVAEAGLTAFHDTNQGMQYQINGTEVSLSEVLKQSQGDHRFEAVEVRGSSTKRQTFPVTFNESE